MQLRHSAAAAAVALFFFLLLSLTTTTTQAHNITRILAKYPEFSTFSHYLTVTQLAPEINRRETITICAVDNAAMSDLLSKHLSVGAIRNVLSLHVLLDYFDAKKLHQITDGTALAATMFQATGSASGSSGFVNITDLKGGKVGFSPEDNPAVSASFVKTVDAVPYNISVIQISSLLPSAEAEAPAPAPSQKNISALMSAHGCKVFADTLISIPDAAETFDSNLESGLTIFCPGDDAMKVFMPKFKNLTAAGKQSLLEYHAMPIYNSMAELKSSNGPTNTLATDGSRKFDFTVQNDGADVTIITRVVTATIVNTLIDEQPLAIYELNKVLMPAELFKGMLAPAPAPTPDAESPKPSKKKGKRKAVPAAPADTPAADAPDGDVADQTADSNGAAGFDGGRFVAVVLSLWFAFLQM